MTDEPPTKPEIRTLRRLSFLVKLLAERAPNALDKRELERIAVELQEHHEVVLGLLRTNGEKRR